MSALIEKREKLDQILENREKVLVLFYASWCPYSRMFLQIFEKAANGRPNEFCRVLADEMEGCEDQYSIEVFPTVIYFEKGNIGKRLDGKSGRGIEEHEFMKLISSCGLAKDKA